MELASKIRPMSVSWFLSSLLPVILVIYIVCVPGCCVAGADLPEDYLPQIQILEIISSPTNRSTAVNLWKDKNNDIIIGEDTSATSRILMKCNATYPVQWVYLGDGRPEFTTFTNVKWQEDPNVPLSFEAEASLGLLGFQGVLREEDTGNYTCRSIQEPAINSYYYIFVPGDRLFAAGNGTNITYSAKDQYIRIPCGVSHPKATATLCRKDKDDKLNCPVTGASGFNTKGGFLINLKKQRNPSGTYVCTVNYKGTVRIAEHYVMRDDEKPKEPSPAPPPPTFPTKPGGNLCDPSPCGKQADCSVVNGRAVCYCFRGLSGNPYDECAPGRCRSSKECPRGKFCRQGQCTTDPCNPSPCGKGGECTLYRGQSKCSCQRGYTGLPPSCVKSCNQNEDCAEDEACIKAICQSPCPGPCGQNAECRVLLNGSKRTAQCSCPAGLLGDPLKHCYKFNSTTPGPWNSCPPGYVGFPPACQHRECMRDSDCPSRRKCMNGLCDKGTPPVCPGKCGMNAECVISPTTSNAICVCPTGMSGNPAVQCFPSGVTPTTYINPSTSWGDPCNPNPCQRPAECHFVQGSRVCVCPPGFTGDPSNCYPATSPAYPSSSTGTTSGTHVYCRHNGECKYGENCIEGYCRSATPTYPSSSTGTTSGTHVYCRHNGECKPGDNCIEGQCRPPPPTNPSSSTGTTSGTHIHCRHDIECKHGDYCIEGYCRPPPPTHPSSSTGTTTGNHLYCRYDVECKTGDICIEGHCRPPPPTYPSSSTGTTSGTHIHCRHDGECKHGENCLEGYCRTPPPTYPSSGTSTTTGTHIHCHHDGECKHGQNCIEGRCRDSDPCNGICGYNAICEPAYGRKYRSIFTTSRLLRSQQQPESSCSCPPGHEGNPYVSCIPIRSAPPPSQPALPPATTSAKPVCFPNPCARFADCTSFNDAPLCRCQPGFEGDPYKECIPSRFSPSPSDPHSPLPRPTQGRGATPVSPVELDYQGHSWGHHTGLDTKVPASPTDQNFHDSTGSSRWSSRPPTSPMSPHHHSRPPFPESPPSSGYGSGNFDGMQPSHYPPSFHAGETPTPKTLDPPMSPLLPLQPPMNERDECTFRNPYADYDMDSCGVGLRCERDFRGIKRCVCISPFDCTGPTSAYARNKCQTNRDCLLSDHICINGTCGNPCSPEFSPCAGIAFAECRVIEGNVLCTCRRGYVGNPSNGLDCRLKRLSLPTSPSGHMGHHNGSGDYVINISSHAINNFNSSRFNMTDYYDDNDNSIINDDDSYDDDDIIISAGKSTAPGPTARHHRRHDNHAKKGEKIHIGRCGFGSGQNCDEKSHCRVVNGRPMCVCKAGYRGEYPNCKPECEKHEDCNDSMACQYHQCMDPCIEEKLYCAKNAFCRVVNHLARCECESGYVGVPWIQCTKAGVESPKDNCMGFNCQKKSE